MSSRPLTPPCVPFGTRRFNRISARTRTGQGCCNIQPVRVFLLRLPSVYAHSSTYASRLYGNCSLPSPAIPVYPAALDSLLSLSASSIASKYNSGNGGAASRPILASLSSCSLSRSSPTIPGCRSLRSASPFGHFCPDCGKSVLLIWLWLSS